MNINKLVKLTLTETTANIAATATPFAPIGGKNLILSDIYPGKKAKKKSDRVKKL